MRTPIETQCFGDSTNPAVYFISGWAMPASVSNAFIELLSQSYYVVTANLPGVTSDENWFKRNRFGPNYDIDALAEQLIRSAPKPCWWIGWSLGGEIASYVAARRSSCVEGLITIGSMPRFTKSDVSNVGTDSSILDNFRVLSLKQPAKALSRFLLQQTQGLPDAKVLYQSLREGIDDALVDPEALVRGLDLLATLNVHRELSLLDLPSLHLFGELDVLAHSDSMSELVAQNDNLNLAILPQCGHQPHIEQPEQTLALIQQFINDNSVF